MIQSNNKLIIASMTDEMALAPPLAVGREKKTTKGKRKIQESSEPPIKKNVLPALPVAQEEKIKTISGEWAWESNVQIELLHMCNNYHKLHLVGANLYAEACPSVDPNPAVRLNRSLTSLEDKWFCGPLSPFKKLDKYWDGRESGKPAKLADLINQGILTVEDGQLALLVANELALGRSKSPSPWHEEDVNNFAMVKSFYLSFKNI